jgi:hypothetical protein
LVVIANVFSTANFEMQARDVMRMLGEFVQGFEEFMTWIKKQPPESEEAIQRFESLSSVIEQTQLLRNIQGVNKESLEMLKGIFDDQIQVLKAASEEFEQDNLQSAQGRDVDVTVKQNLGSRYSGRSLANQSLRNAKLIERMQSQAAQSYDTVCSLFMHNYCHLVFG